jgi:hypothetical protein
MPFTEGFEIVNGAHTTWVSVEADGPFHCENIAPFYEAQAVELVNRQIPGGDEATYPPVPVGTRIAVQVTVFGEYELNGDPVDPADAHDQCELLLQHLIAYVAAPVDTPPGTATFNLYRSGGELVGTQPVQFVGGLKPAPDNPSTATVTFDMYFPPVGVPAGITGS